MGLPKPERVEVGQWWHSQSQGLMRVPTGCAPAFQWFLDPTSSAVYLGSGEHPEPSEWMIETLAAHAYETRAGGYRGWEHASDTTVTSLGDAAKSLLQDPANAVGLRNEQRGAVLHMYRILRDLGKW